MITFYQKPNTDHRDSRQFLDLNGDDYEITEDPSADYDAVLAHPLESEYHRPNNLKPCLRLMIWHGDPDHVDRLIESLEANPLDHMVFNGTSDQQHERLRYVDWLFNRTKAYYSGYPFRSDRRLWYWTGPENYQWLKLSTSQEKTKIFLAPNRCHFNHHPNRHFRCQLVKWLERYHYLGHIGNWDPHDPRGDVMQHLVSNAEAPECRTLTEVAAKLDREYRPKYWSGYLPIHHAYLTDTFISIYTESIDRGQTIMITEKTYDPIMRGHLILPFAAQGMIKHLESLGWTRPRSIDYGYDNIANDGARFTSYLAEVERLLSLTRQAWCDIWELELDTLWRNQQWMYWRAYDRVDLKSLLKLG